MTILVVANDVIPGLGVPVAAPGIRAAGLAEGLKANGFSVELSIPKAVLDQVWTRPTPLSPPPGTTVLDPVDLSDFIAARRFSHVVFTNANMAPHLRPQDGTKYVFDMFAPKILELLSSDRRDRDWTIEASKKERAIALADAVWVNGRRKVGYALGWLLRPSVERIRTERFGKPSLIVGDPMRHISVVNMPIPLPSGVGVRPAGHRAAGPLRVGIAGYQQRWSVGGGASPAQLHPLSLGHEVHVLAPTHWGSAAPDPPPTPTSPESAGLVVHNGPLDYPDFARWIQSMDLIADAYEQSAERTMAMITRTTVALRFGVPAIHGVDSEVSDLIREFDAGWVIDPADDDAWKSALAEASDPETLHAKQSGAIRLSTERFDPAAALQAAALSLAEPS